EGTKNKHRAGEGNPIERLPRARLLARRNGADRECRLRLHRLLHLASLDGAQERLSILLREAGRQLDVDLDGDQAPRVVERQPLAGREAACVETARLAERQRVEPRASADRGGEERERLRSGASAARLRRLVRRDRAAGELG